MQYSYQALLYNKYVKDPDARGKLPATSSSDNVDD